MLQNKPAVTTLKQLCVTTEIRELWDAAAKPRKTTPRSELLSGASSPGAEWLATLSVKELTNALHARALPAVGDNAALASELDAKWSVEAVGGFVGGSDDPNADITSSVAPENEEVLMRLSEDTLKERVEERFGGDHVFKNSPSKKSLVALLVTSDITKLWKAASTVARAGGSRGPYARKTTTTAPRALVPLQPDAPPPRLQGRPRGPAPPPQELDSATLVRKEMKKLPSLVRDVATRQTKTGENVSFTLIVHDKSDDPRMGRAGSGDPPLRSRRNQFTVFSSDGMDGVETAIDTLRDARAPEPDATADDASDAPEPRVVVLKSLADVEAHFATAQRAPEPARAPPPPAGGATPGVAEMAALLSP